MLTKSSLKTEYSRLYPAIAEEEPEEEASPTSTSPTDMTAAFQEFMTAEKRAAPTPSSDLWSKRVELFTETEERPPCLELLHSALSTVPPTSVEAERIFSICVVDNFILQLEAAFLLKPLLCLFSLSIQ